MTTSQDSRRALATAVLEIERHAATSGWDGPVLVFALVRTAQAVRHEPAFAAHLPDPARATADPHHLTAIEQESLPRAETLEELLASLAWPETVDGAAVVVERVIVTHGDDTVLGPAEALASPDRQDVRIAVGVLRDGTAWCALRLRSHDDDSSVISAPDTVPGLVEALRETLA
ncbi:MAG: PPA1309 family protein [Actinomycetota bacterium]